MLRNIGAFRLTKLKKFLFVELFFQKIPLRGKNQDDTANNYVYKYWIISNNSFQIT